MSDSKAIPEQITCSEQVFSVSFHPQRPFLAAGLIDGTVELWEHEHEEFAANRFYQSLEHHKSSCRSLLFHPNGQHLYTTSSDKSWCILNTEGNLITRCTQAHNHPINRMMMLDEYLFTTGDDIGVVKLWDNRVNPSTNAVMSWDAHTDFIADFDYYEENHQLFSASGDATLCVYDIRNEKHFYKSDDQESELHCVQVMKGGRKVVCGCQDGVMLLFNAGQFGDCSDRIPGHPETVDCMWKIDENSVLTGSSDGMIRVISVLPNKVLGVLGDQEDVSVEDITANHDRTLLASVANDEKIRFWDISILIDEDGDEEEDDDEDSSDEDNDGEKKGVKNTAGEEMDSDDDEEEGDEEADSDGDEEEDDEEDSDAEEEEDSDASSDSDDEDKNKPKKPIAPKKTNDTKKNKKEESSDDSDDSDDGPQNKRKRLPTAAEKFYADM